MKVIVDQGDSLVSWHSDRELVTFSPISATHNYIKPDGFAKDLTILGHAFGHAYIQYYGAKGNGLNPTGESGALYVSIADTIGIMVDHFDKKVKANGQNTSWLIGTCFQEHTGLFGTELEPVPFHERHAIRSMEKPGHANPFDDQWTGDKSREGHPIDHYDRYQNIAANDDPGEIFYNCGIPNKAFQLAATALQRPSYETIGHIWIEALHDCEENFTFAQFAELTAAKAKSSEEKNIVRKAWFDVGVLENQIPPPPIQVLPRRTRTWSEEFDDGIGNGLQRIAKRVFMRPESTE